MIDLRLYLVADPARSENEPLLPRVAAALEGGVTAVQLRDKNAAPRRLLPLGEELVRIMRRRGLALIVNDRVDLALALGADGAHVGTEDLPATEARRLIPRPRILGVSAGSVEEATAGVEAEADYLGVGPVFATGSKPDAGEPIGLSGLAAISRAVSIPVVGIGGIDRTNAAAVVEAGAAGIAVISALMTGPDPEAEARLLRRLVDEALARRGASEVRPT